MLKYDIFCGFGMLGYFKKGEFNDLQQRIIFYKECLKLLF
jgi:hypothetical protein